MRHTIKALTICVLLLIQSFGSFCQVDTLRIVLRGCAIDAIRLDSCQASSLYDDSAITILLEQRDALFSVYDLQKENINRLHEIQWTYEDQADILTGEIKKQKKRKIMAFFKGLGVGGIIVLILLL